MIKSLGFLLLRLSIGIMLIHHGYEKLDSIENFADAFVRPLHIPFPITMSYLAAFSEIGGSWLLIFGLGTRLGALAIMGTQKYLFLRFQLTTQQKQSTRLEFTTQKHRVRNR